MNVSYSFVNAQSSSETAETQAKLVERTRKGEIRPVELKLPVQVDLVIRVLG